MRLNEIAPTVRDAAKNLLADRGLQLSAALSYYSALSLAPLLLLLLALVGAVVGRDAVAGELIAQMRGLLGDAGADIATQIIHQTAPSAPRALAGIMGLVTLLVGASGVFLQLQEAMNIIWEVKPVPRKGVWGLIRKRVLSLGMLLAIAFLLLVSLAISAGLAALNRHAAALLPGAEFLWRSVHFVVSIGLFTVLFASLFKYLPDVIISWRDVWIGASATSVLFALGKLLIGLYLGRGAVGSAYGAAGSIIVVLVWVYYSSVILFFGAELTQIYADKFGEGIRPAAHAVLTRQPDGTATGAAPSNSMA